VLDQRAARSRFKNESAEELRQLRDAEVPLLALIDGESRTPLARIHDSASVRPVRVDRAAEGAEAIGIFLGGPPSQARSLDARARDAALVARALLDNCAGAEAQWLEAFEELARLASPYLERGAVAVLFEKAQASRCFKSLDEASRDRVRLLQAMNDRDADAMTQVATRLIDNARAGGDRGTYVLAAMAGHLAKGRRDEARILAEKQFATLAPAQRDSLAMRLAIAQAFQRPAAAQP
jgi:hypothetical protein